MQYIKTLLIILPLTLTACADPELPPLGQTDHPVVGGAKDDKSKAVVGLGVGINTFFFGHCTGTLIAPNLVLTARHCVALTQSPGAYGGVVCGKTPFTLQGPGALFRVTVETVRPKADGPSFYKGIGTVFVDKTANDICGYDVALIMLEGKGIPASVTKPMTPRLETNAVKGETFSAVGYGLTKAGGKTSGTRMRIDGRKVLCFKKSCTEWVKDTEFGSDAPTCQGDSGGPAIDSKGRVFGVLSRGPTGCTSSVYGDVASNKKLIVAAAMAAAKSGGYPLPDWAKAHAPADAGPEGGVGDHGASDATLPDAKAPDAGAPAPEDEGCAVSSPSRGAPAAGVAALALGLFILLGRRRRL